MTAGRIRHSHRYLISFFLVLLLACFCYWPGQGGAIQLDDIGNLGDLAYVEDAGTAADFVLAGKAGPLGRPIALLTFALQAEHWGQGASAFLRINILIHLLNALILAACLYQLARLRAIEHSKSILVATAAAGMWVIMPLLATASLLVVQRMTTLSALFMLLGLGGYLLARSRIEAAPTRALTWMSFSIGVGTLLAALCKESGLLLPAFVLVLEATVIGRPQTLGKRIWRIWHAAFLLLPTLAIVAYLASIPPYPDWLVARRDFGAWERLLTEAQILWVYLQKALLGLPAHLGVYQTPPAVSRSLFAPLTFLASISWLALAAVSIAWRRRYPLFALAVLWYLAGHLIESSVVPLELYFEHRNYLPVIGPLFAVCAWLLPATRRLRGIGLVCVSVYILASAYFLHSFASLWGEPSLASRYWAFKYPDSARAVTTMASYQLSEEGPLRALATIDRFVIENPQYAYLRIQELNLRCMYLPDQDHAQVLAELQRGLPTVDFTYTAGTMLSEFFSTVIQRKCNGIDFSTVTSMAEWLLRNPRYANDRLYRQFHYKLLAGIARQQGDETAALEHLQQAIAYGPSSELNSMMVTMLAASGDFAAATAFIEAAMAQQPGNLLRAAAWQRELQKLREYIRELERYSQSQQRPKPTAVPENDGT
ncbi:MAG: hypothetical protein OEM60_05515 [Gammaproteobacteria bacterium]|nr:hypothetical protein [Gammaproteobacteria bacterium]MDH3433293.1 hypothetical protein [Gammaproteobacteria bacterium]